MKSMPSDRSEEFLRSATSRTSPIAKPFLMILPHYYHGLRSRASPALRNSSIYRSKSCFRHLKGTEILASLLSRGAIAGQPGPPNHRPAPLGPVALLGLAAWCGTVAGLLEVAAVVVRKRFFDSNHLLGMSRHFIWLVPLTDLLIFLLVGLVGCLVVILRPAGGRWAVARTLCVLTMLPMLLGAFPQVYGLAWLLVALGVSARLVPILERHGLAFRRVVLSSAPILAVTLAALAAIPWAADRVQQGREQGRPIPTEAPNVLLIVMDTVAAEHLALYGYERPTSPAIEELARRGSRFDAALSASSWTLPSHASMFTGRWPHELSVGWRTPLDAAAPTVAEFLRARGYATAGFIANMSYCAADSGLGRGYTVYRDYIFYELSPFKLAVMVQKSLDGLQTIGDVLGDTLELNWLTAGVNASGSGSRPTARRPRWSTGSSSTGWRIAPNRSGRSSPS